MNRIAAVFTRLKKEKRKALIPYICCGDPTMEFTKQLAITLAQSGADIIELGIPFSDPVADGPVIQKSAVRALAGGATLDKIFTIGKQIRAQVSTPLVMMTYFNLIYVRGIKNFIKDAKNSGINGLIVPDLPVEEGKELLEAAEKEGLALIYLVTPNTSAERIKLIAERSRGFLYCVSVKGVTGARKELDKELANFIHKTRNITDLPIAVGFGIANPEMAGEVASFADGAIIGSALIEQITEHITGSKIAYDQALDQAGNFIRNIKKAL